MEAGNHQAYLYSSTVLQFLVMGTKIACQDPIFGVLAHIARYLSRQLPAISIRLLIHTLKHDNHPSLSNLCQHDHIQPACKDAPEYVYYDQGLWQELLPTWLNITRIWSGVGSKYTQPAWWSGLSKRPSSWSGAGGRWEWSLSVTDMGGC